MPRRLAPGPSCCRLLACAAPQPREPSRPPLLLAGRASVLISLLNSLTPPWLPELVCRCVLASLCPHLCSPFPRFVATAPHPGGPHLPLHSLSNHRPHPAAPRALPNGLTLLCDRIATVGAKTKARACNARPTGRGGQFHAPFCRRRSSTNSSCPSGVTPAALLLLLLLSVAGRSGSTASPCPQKPLRLITRMSPWQATCEAGWRGPLVC